MVWAAFNVAIKNRRTSLTVEGVIYVQTDLTITYKNGDVIGYVYALKAYTEKIALPLNHGKKFAGKSRNFQNPGIHGNEREQLSLPTLR